MNMTLVNGKKNNKKIYKCKDLDRNSAKLKKCLTIVLKWSLRHNKPKLSHFTITQLYAVLLI